jgi:negative regulator of replication initiation
MSPSIELDQEIFDLLKSKAEPFVDTPNSVLRRLLGLGASPAASSNSVSPVEQAHVVTSPRAGKSAKKKAAKSAAPKRTRAAAGTLLPEVRYELPLLKALVDTGGQAPYREVVEAVGRELKDDLLPADFENLNSGAVRWQSRLQFVRLRLIERGYLDKDAPRGVWVITDQGRAALAEGQPS